MKTKKRNPIIFIIIVLFTGLLILPSLHGETTGKDNVSQHLETLEKLINPQQALSWSLVANGDPPVDYSPGRSTGRQEFAFKTTIKGVTDSCGVRVKNTPMELHLKFYSRGLSEARVTLNGKETGSFVIDGSTGTGAELEQTVTLTPKTAPQDYDVVIHVKNKGFHPPRTEFWPPRRSELKEEDIAFSLKEAAVIFPAAAENHRLLNDWLLSMKIGHALLNPDFVRYTFIGKPFNIEDKRKTPKERLAKLKKLLEQAVMTITPAMLTTGAPKKAADAVKRSYQLSEPLKAFAKEFKVYLIGNAHIDIAWLWRMKETVMVARNTYDTVLKNMDEYPELRYAQSQALTYRWMEKQYPEIFAGIERKVKQGQWEIVGGMWVEPDCNLISGESWVRQLLYGKRYFKKKFGLDIDTGWNPDSFGYNWNMPQIYSKSGIKRFITQKIWWNDTTVFPHFIFWWRGVDDTRLLTYFPPVGYTSRVKMPQDVVNITRYEATTGYKKTLILYGIGDHGGGPNREILNRVRNYKTLHIAPEFIHSPSIDFLRNMNGDLQNDIPVWKDELYLEYHRGTYTTQASVKKNNRRCESLLSSAEKTASIVYLMENMKKKSYPAKELEKAWKVVLTNQFHDILPGSSINPVYHDAREDYKKTKKKIKNIIAGSLETIAAKIDTSNVQGEPLVIFNPLSWKRTDVVSLELDLPKNHTVKIFDANGNEVPVEQEWKKDKREIKLTFIAAGIPAIGHAVFSIAVSQGKPPKDKKTASQDSGFIRLENRFFKVTVNKKSGNIASIHDKRLNVEWVAKGKEANVLQVYEDRPENWDAWNIGYTGRMWELNEAGSVELVEDSPVRQVVKVEKSFLGLAKSRYSPTEEFPSSFFEQRIILYRDLDRIDIETEADWWEEHMFLKAAFPVRIESDYATYEIPFASIKRTTKSETLWEKARFEVPALRWGDLSNQKYGISLLNDSKYGYDIHGNTIKISLLRAPTWPDPMADRGGHSFTYSLYPHAGAVTDGGTVQRARELNNPLLVIKTGKHAGSLPTVYSFFSVESPSVILDGIKKTEDGDGIILRLYESAGKETQAKIHLFKAPRAVHETDLMETTTGEHKTSGKTLSLQFKRFEIKTLKLAW
jgi:alpha-mannosidase